MIMRKKKERKTMSKASELKNYIDEETQAVKKWLNKKHLAACWVYENKSDKVRFEIKRGCVSVKSKTVFTKEQVDSLTYSQMKEMIMQMYAELKEKENEK